VQILGCVVSQQGDFVFESVDTTAAFASDLLLLPVSLTVTIAKAATTIIKNTIFVQSLLFFGWQQLSPQSQFSVVLFVVSISSKFNYFFFSSFIKLI
jgi:hypothetical protein